MAGKRICPRCPLPVLKSGAARSRRGALRSVGGARSIGREGSATLRARERDRRDERTGTSEGAGAARVDLTGRVGDPGWLFPLRSGGFVRRAHLGTTARLGYLQRTRSSSLRRINRRR